jgi:hypothetical protein
MAKRQHRVVRTARPILAAGRLTRFSDGEGYPVDGYRIGKKSLEVEQPKGSWLAKTSAPPLPMRPVSRRQAGCLTAWRNARQIALLALAVTSCGGSIEEQCQVFLSTFVGCGMVNASGITTDQKNCSTNFSNAGGPCQDAFSKATSCVKDKTCSELKSDACSRELGDLVTKCPTIYH